MRKVIGGLIVAVSWSVVVACSSGDPDPKPTPTSSSVLSRDNSAAQAAWTFEAKVIGRPAVSDDVAVVIVRTGNKALEIDGVDTSSGKKLWSHPFSPGGTSSGYAVEAQVFTSASGRKVTAFAEPPKDLNAPTASNFHTPIDVVDLKSGKLLFRTRAVRMWGPLEPCVDGTDICVELDANDGGGGQRITIDDKSLGRDPNGLSANARSIGSHGLFATDDRPNEQIGVRRDGTTLWSEAGAKLMGAKVVTDNGWRFTHEKKADRYVGTLYAPSSTTDTGRTIPASGFVSAGFDGKTGKRIWQSTNVETNCIVSNDGVGLDDETTVGYDDEHGPVRCRFSGTWSFSYNDTENSDTSTMTTSVEGYDPATGKTRWSVRLDADGTKAVLEGTGGIVTNGDTLVLSTVDGPRLVASVSGKSVKPGDDTFACATTVHFDYAIPYVYDGTKYVERTGDSVYRPCTAGGADKKKFSVAAVRDVGSKSGSIWVVATSDGLTGFTLK